jgi:MFS family permease
MFIYAFAMISMALLAHINDKTVFMTVAILSRVGQGFASSLIQTTCFSMTGTIYGDHQSKVIALLQLTV